jgi:mannitol/fructose-specific phosphotransferase system IIA component (Ntr-type)
VKPDDDIESTLQNLQQDGATICVVNDGGMPMGLITIEDILERLIGRIEDEYPRHPATRLHEMAVVDDTLLDLTGTTSHEAIREIAGRIPPACLPSGVDIAALAIERERELPTHLGFGVAVPHARCPGLSAPFVVFGRSHGGVVFDSDADHRVHLIFLLVTPADQPQYQVQILGHVARIATDAAKRESLQQAAGREDVIEVFRSVQ